MGARWPVRSTWASGNAGPWLGPALSILILIAGATAADAAIGEVLSQHKITDGTAGFTGPLHPGDRFGEAVIAVGDLDLDGVGDMAVGAREDDDGGANAGAVWILFLDGDGAVIGQRKISSRSGDLHGHPLPDDRFGNALALLGDIDEDGVVDLAVGAPDDDAGGPDTGAVWILFMRRDGTVRSFQRIAEDEGGLSASLDDDDSFGFSITSIGDLDGDGATDMIVASFEDDDGGVNAGALWVLFLDHAGRVIAEQKISALAGGFLGDLDPGDGFGSSLARLGDLDGDGTLEVAVGAYRDDDGGTDRGAVWILSLDPDGTVDGLRKISAMHGGFLGELSDSDNLGSAVAALGDFDGDGVTDMAVGAQRDDDGGQDRGAIWIMFLQADGAVRDFVKISQISGGFGGVLGDQDIFGHSIGYLGDFDGDGLGNLAVGASMDDQAFSDAGAVWMLTLIGPGTVSTPDATAAEIGPRAVPNPFTTSTTVTLAADSDPGALAIHDVSGRWVTDLPTRPGPDGRRIAVWDGRDARGRRVRSGCYYLATEHARAKTLVVIR